MPNVKQSILGISTFTLEFMNNYFSIVNNY